MKKQIQHFAAARKNILAAAEGLTDVQLNHIPAGFSNNLAWNMGHVLVTQQLLQYKLAGEAMRIPTEWVDLFRKGTKPEGDFSPEILRGVKEMLPLAAGWLEEDIAAGKFQKYQEYPTSFGITLRTFEDALDFNNIHEGMHFGYMLALKKAHGA